MKPDYFDLRQGLVTPWAMDEVDPEQPLSDQIDSLVEDLAQVQYAPNITLDIGWYPECSRDGGFAVLVVRDENWERPVFEKRCPTAGALAALVTEGVAVAERLTGNSTSSHRR